MSFGWVVWLVGRPASGKSTLAWAVAGRLKRLGMPCAVLDGDLVRASLVPNPGYSKKARDGFYTTLALLAGMLARQGLVVLVPATAHRRFYRRRARALAPKFLEVHVDVSLQTCAERDTKGLYEKARAGKIDSLPGVGEPFEVPEQPDVVARGGKDRAAVEAIVRRLAGRRATRRRSP